MTTVLDPNVHNLSVRVINPPAVLLILTSSRLKVPLMIASQSHNTLDPPQLVALTFSPPKQRYSQSPLRRPRYELHAQCRRRQFNQLGPNPRPNDLLFPCALLTPQVALLCQWIEDTICSSFWEFRRHPVRIFLRHRTPPHTIYILTPHIPLLTSTNNYQSRLVRPPHGPPSIQTHHRHKLERHPPSLLHYLR
jgi:hypothetical protein